MPTALPALTLEPELSSNIHHSQTRERCPDIRFVEHSTDGRRLLGGIRTDVEKPRLDLPDGAIRHIDASYALSLVIDEPAWLAELARVLAPGGTLQMAMLASGPLAWFDARNAYRYITDILGRGHAPDETLPTGWNRHYADRDLVAMLEDAGFTDIQNMRVGVGLAEPVQLGGLMFGNFLLRRRDTELRLHPLRRKLERIDEQIPAPGIGTRFAITARRAAAEPDDPADDDATGNRPAPEIDHE